MKPLRAQNLNSSGCPDIAEQPLAFRRLHRTELPAATIALARFLVGKIVVRELPSGRLAGRIVETEAYPPRDPAAHHFRGPTPRNRSMFLRRGHAYVYFSYGNHFMLNVSAELPGIGGGILIRALEPLVGIPQMQANRRAFSRKPDIARNPNGGANLSNNAEALRVLDLARGPGRLAAALQIDRSLDGIDLCAPGPLWLAALTPAGRARLHISSSPRIGITRAAHRLLRFFERGSAFVSGPTRLNLRQQSAKKSRHHS